MKQRNYKIILIGNALVGKTAIANRFAKDFFQENYLRTLGINYYIETIRIADVKVKLIITDTAGQEAFQRLLSSYYKGAKGAIIVYSITDRQSFYQAEMWKTEMEKTVNAIPVILVGNKIDLSFERKVSESEGKNLAKKLGGLFIETSAKTGENISEIFNKLVLEILKQDKELSNYIEEQIRQEEQEK